MDWEPRTILGVNAERMSAMTGTVVHRHVSCCTRSTPGSALARGAVAGLVALLFVGSAGYEVVYEDAGGQESPLAAASASTGSGPGLRPVEGLCGVQWRRARPEQLRRINDRTWMLVDELQKDPTDPSLYSKFETACKDEGDHNTRLRVLATIMRLAEVDEVRDVVVLNQGYALGDRTFGHAKACRFAERDRDFALWAHMWTSGRWASMLEAGQPVPVLPFYALVFPFSMEQVKTVSEVWAAKFGSYVLREAPPAPFPNTFLQEFMGEAPSRRLRIGYISSDVYRVHPVGKSINACLRSHDADRFEVHAFLLVGSQLEELEDLEDGTGGVLLTDLSILSSAEGALAVNEEGIHVLIDLNGHTSGVRMELLAYNPAPVIMHYMGFGATTGAEYIHYFLGDTAVAPPELAAHYTEKMAYVGASFYVNSYRTDTAAQRLQHPDYFAGGGTPGPGFREARANNSLPGPEGVVLCNFNHLHKTARAQWALWAEILRLTEAEAWGGTVLWTLNDNAVTRANIARELAYHGVNATAMLRYAGHEKIREHLQRHALADLFLDIRDYNGGTTGLDAYWADVPILTAPQEKFSARYGASFNRGAGLDGVMTARNSADYVDVARQLLRRRARLRRIRAALYAAKNASVLFDTRGFMRRFEGLLRMQWEVAWRDGWRGADEAGGPRHALHLVRAGAGDVIPPLHY